MQRKMFTLVLNVPATVAASDERYDFEPRSVWLKQEDGSYNVSQRVYLDGVRLTGESDAFQEALRDVLSDWERFVSLEPLKD